MFTLIIKCERRGDPSTTYIESFQTMNHVTRHVVSWEDAVKKRNYVKVIIDLYTIDIELKIAGHTKTYVFQEKPIKILNPEKFLDD